MKNDYPTVLIERKLGRNRGKARLWIEGKSLLAGGWNHHDRFTVDFAEGMILLSRKTYDGTKAGFEAMLNSCTTRPCTVSGSPDRPIIDINTDRLLDSLGKGTAEVTVSIGPSTITVLPK